MAACPVCETDNPLTAVECAGCGKVLRRPTEVPGFAPPIDGLEPTLQAAVDAPDERVEVERTPHETNGAAQNWTAGPLELDRGREEDPDPRAAPPLPPPDAEPRQIDVVLCPACFARVAAEARCAECGVPLPVRDA